MNDHELKNVISSFLFILIGLGFFLYLALTVNAEVSWTQRTTNWFDVDIGGYARASFADMDNDGDFDAATGETYCVFIRNGKWVQVSGDCKDVDITTDGESVNTSDGAIFDPVQNNSGTNDTSDSTNTTTDTSTDTPNTDTATSTDSIEDTPTDVATSTESGGDSSETESSSDSNDAEQEDMSTEDAVSDTQTTEPAVTEPEETEESAPTVTPSEPDASEEDTTDKASSEVGENNTI